MRLKLFFKIFLVTVFLVIALVSAGLVYAYLNLNQFKTQLLSALNKELLAEVNCSQIELNLIDQFPLVSIGLVDVTVKDTIHFNEPLLQSKSLRIGFDFFDIVAQKYNIEDIVLDEGTINLLKDSTGQVNYLIVKENNSQEPSNESLQLNLKDVQLNKVQVNYLSLIDQQQYQVFIEKAALNGNFNAQTFSLHQELLGQVKTISVAGFEIIHEKAIQSNLDLLVDTKMELISLKSAQIKLSDLNLDLKGQLQDYQTTPKIECEFKSQQTSIQALLSLLPVQLPNSVKSLDSKGKVYFSGHYSGVWSKDEHPLLQLNFGVENGSLLNKQNGVALNQIHFKGQYQSKTKQRNSQLLQISEFKAALNNEPVAGDFEFNLSENPTIISNLRGRINLTDFQKWAQIQNIKQVSGMLEFNTHLQLFKSNNQYVWTHPNNQIELKLDAPLLQLSNLSKPFKQIQLKLKANQSLLVLENVKFLIGESDISGRGTLANVFQPEKDLQISLVTSSGNLNAEDLMVFTSDKSDTSSGNRKFDVLLTCQADAFVFRQLQSTNCLTTLKIEPGKLDIQSLQMQCWDGELKTKGLFAFSNKGFQFNGLLSLKRVQIKQFLEAFNNFNQTAIQSSQINGSIGLESDLEMKWDPDFNFNKHAFKAIAKLKFKDGQLNQYEPLYALSKFVDIESLKNLKFKELENTLEIKQQQLTIPEMYIQTNAMNLLLSGTHTFDNVLDYRLKITLSDLLNKKRKVQTNEFGEEAEKPGQINLFLRIKGPADHLKFTYDHKAVKAKISQELQKEGADLKEILKKEFGFKKDSSIKEHKKSNDKQDELEFEQE